MILTHLSGPGRTVRMTPGVKLSSAVMSHSNAWERLQTPCENVQAVLSRMERKEKKLEDELDQTWLLIF